MNRNYVMIFKTSLDKPAKLITAFVTLLFVVIIVTVFVMIDASQKEIKIIVPVVIVSIYVFTFFFAPKAYIVTSDALCVVRRINKKEIYKQQIKSARVLNANELQGTIRVFGVGGLFGYFGKFHQSNFGSLTLYATRRDRCVLLMTDDKKIIVTPDEPDEFIKALNV